MSFFSCSSCVAVIFFFSSIQTYKSFTALWDCWCRLIFAVCLLLSYLDMIACSFVSFFVIISVFFSFHSSFCFFRHFVHFEDIIYKWALVLFLSPTIFRCLMLVWFCLFWCVFAYSFQRNFISFGNLYVFYDALGNWMIHLTGYSCRFINFVIVVHSLH